MCDVFEASIYEIIPCFPVVHSWNIHFDILAL